MMKEWGQVLVSIFTGILTLAIISVIVSKKSDTAGVLQGAGSTLSNVVSAAVNPLPASSAGASVGGNSAPAFVHDLLGNIDIPLSQGILQ